MKKETLLEKFLNWLDQKPPWQRVAIVSGMIAGVIAGVFVGGALGFAIVKIGGAVAHAIATHGALFASSHGGGLMIGNIAANQGAVLASSHGVNYVALGGAVGRLIA